uniref:Mitochondrial carrier protein MTM1-like isoform X1 n=1 Tax=Rhizophora mucronata TaxID=61149 RepID=A0A2P2JGN9_RHIMU
MNAILIGALIFQGACCILRIDKMPLSFTFLNFFFSVYILIRDVTGLILCRKDLEDCGEGQMQV